MPKIVLVAQRRRGSSLAEFGPVLVVLILVIIFPLVNLLAWVAGYATVNNITQACGAEAANAASFSEALANVQKRANLLSQSGLAKFARIRPQGGYQSCGVDLYVVTTSIDADPNHKDPTRGHLFGPNTGLPADFAQTEKIEQSNGAVMYEYSVRTNFWVGPVLDLSQLPFVGSVPMVGKDVLLGASTTRAVEHSDALTP